MYNYQGSVTGISQAIIETFEKARNYAQKSVQKMKKKKRLY